MTRGVVKIIQTDPDSFFSSRSGTLSSTAAPTYHLAPSPPPSVAPFPFLSFFFFLFFSISTSSFVVIVPASSPLSPIVLSSHCPDAEFEIAPDDLVAFMY